MALVTALSYTGLYLVLLQTNHGPMRVGGTYAKLHVDYAVIGDVGHAVFWPANTAHRAIMPNVFADCHNPMLGT